jgi:hypothetical protein
MALDGTYAGLKASVADFLNRSDLTAVIPDFITIAEAQMTRRFVGQMRKGLPYPRRIMQRTDATINLADEYIPLPADFHGPIDFVLQGTPEIVLDYLDPTNFQQWKEANPYSGMAPVYYTVISCQLQIYPVADIAYTAELTYLKRFAAASTEANWILTDYPDAYLYGALTAAAPYLKNDERMQVWGQLFTAAIDDICNADPMPGDKSTLRTEFPRIQRWGVRGRYDINTDTL